MKKKKYEKPDFVSQEAWDEYLQNVDKLGKNLFKMINNIVKKTNKSLEKKEIIDDDLEFVPCPDDKKSEEE